MNALIWFRNDLRIHDNPMLQNSADADRTIAVYCFDPRHFQKGKFGFKKTERYRAKFLIETVKNLRKNLAALNITLFVFYGQPEEVMPDLIKKHKVDVVHFQNEWTMEEQHVLSQLKKQLNNNILFKSCFGQFLFHPDDIPYDRYQDIPKTFTGFRKKVEDRCSVRSLANAPVPQTKENYLETDTEIPTLEELGYENFKTDPRAAFNFKGGEDAALQRLEHYFWSTQRLATYKTTRNGLLGTDYSSKLSPWLANGSLSPKMVYWEIKKFEQQIIENQSTYWLIFELIWRDYFKYISLKHGSAIFKIGGVSNKNYDWCRDAAYIDRWIQGETAAPFVNANMIEIAKTGWMSNRGRQNVASYFSKELKIDWRIGASYFESMLIDYDVHSNWGNWMYVSGVGNDPRNRKFNIKKQSEKYDPEGEFRKLWIV